MKLLFKITPDNVSSHNRSTNGYEFIQTVESMQDAYDVVSKLEDSDFYPQDDGFVLSANGNEVFDPKYADQFDFVDYKFYVMDTEALDVYDDAHIIRAIENEAPFNLEEIKEIISQ